MRYRGKSPQPVEQRFLSKVEKVESGCWQWKASAGPTGYGHFSMRHPNGGWEMRIAHRVSYELFVGPIPEGLELDHLCKNRGCVNPTHLEPVTRKENCRRGGGPTGDRARQTHCKRGHLLEGDNLRIRKQGWRNCRTCDDMWNALASEKRKAARVPRTHCKWGHEFTPENTLMDRGGRQCVICTRKRARRGQARYRAKGRALASQ